MTDQRWRRAQGLKRLLHDGVRLGSAFVEKHHRHAADKPFALLEAIEPIAAPAMAARALHGGMLSLTYTGIRAVNSATERVGDWILERLEDRALEPSEASERLSAVAEAATTNR